jgi:hypothetical protein
MAGIAASQLQGTEYMALVWARSSASVYQSGVRKGKILRCIVTLIEAMVTHHVAIILPHLVRVLRFSVFFYNCLAFTLR